MSDSVFIHEWQGRRPRNLVFAGGLIGWAIIARFLIDLHSLWMLALIMLGGIFLFEYWRDPEARLQLDDTGLHGQLGGETWHFPKDQIEGIKMNTRLDFSRRVTIHLKSGEQVVLHPTLTPPAEPFIAALTAQNIRHRVTHFTFL